MSVHPTRTGKYEVRYREGTRNRSKTFDRKGDATTFDREWRTKRQLGQQIIRPKDTPILDDLHRRFTEKRAADGIATNTLLFNASVMEKHLTPWLGFLRVAEITPEHLDDWQRECPATPYMMNRAMEYLGQLLTYAKRLRFVSVNHAADLERRQHETREGQTTSPERVEQIRAYFLERERLGYATMISVLAYTGVRSQELRKLTWASLDGRRLRLDRKTTKTKRPRSLEVPSPVLSDFAQWRLSQRSPEGLIFPRTDGMEWRKTDWDNWRKRWFNKAIESAGIEGDFVPYDLRHTCASLMIRSGAPPAEVAEHMGHGLGVLFSTYAHMIEEMRGKPVEPIEAAILRARGSDVRRTFGVRAS